VAEGLGVLLADAEADAVGEAGAVVVDAVGEAGAVVVGAVVVGGGDEAGVPLGVADGLADGLAETGELGASCVQAAMTTRSLAGSALPPRPLRSTK
jgi:hypothetical protein